MAEYSYSISLRIVHPTLDLGAVTAALGITPSVIWRVGEPRVTPKGTPLPTVAKKSFWTARIVEGSSLEGDLNSALGRALDAVAAGSSLFAELTSSGGEVEFFVGWFIEGGNSGDVLNHHLFGRLAAMHIDLSFDIYGDSSNTEGPA
jgi:hypothetical protein